MLETSISKDYFDFVFCLEVLSYLKDDKKAILEIKRTLCKSGMVMIGLTLGHGYCDYKKIISRLKSNFEISNEDFILPKPFPGSSNKYGRLALLFYKLFPSKMRLKVCVLLKKNEK